MTEPMPDPSGAKRYPLLAQPHVQLSGAVDENMYFRFRTALGEAPAQGTLVVSMTTLGGDPEVARAMGDDIRLLREFHGREILFLGKVAVYSAGATFMAAFPVEHRFLTRRTSLLIHERQIYKTINLNGPLRMMIPSLKAALHEIEHSVEIEEEGFRALIAGSSVTFEEVHQRAPENWYIEAEEALRRGLVLDVI